MAAYPSYRQLLGDEPKHLDDIEITRAGNGDLRGYSLRDARKLRIPVSHVLNAADRAALISFYDANRLADIDLTWERTGDVVTCRFVEPPAEQALGGGWFRMTSTLEAV